MDTTQFEYSSSAPLDLRKVGRRKEDGIETHLFTYHTPHGVRRVGEIIRPTGEGTCAAILYVHWLAETPDANRTQFIEEAKEMAKRGVVSLLVETMWSEQDWFIKRTQEDDQANSARQVVELRQAMDILLAEPGIDPDRFAYVGHDFGAMYGSLMGAVDPRPTHYVLMAATPRFTDWYLYYPKLEGEAREAFVQQFAPLDPINQVAKLSPAPLLFQFANEDEHVPKERAEEFYAAAADPKEIRWYEAGHGLNDEARQDRVAWLSEQLGLRDSA